MTKTALKNKEIESNERIADNRNAAELKKAKEVEEMREKHERKENMKDRIANGIFGLLPKSSFSVRTNFNPRKKDDGLAFKNPGYWNNDPEWYHRYPVDVGAWANINTYNRVGQVKFGGRFYKLGTDEFAIPGIMTFNWIPSIGPTGSAEVNDRKMPINLTLQRSRQKVLELNSRSNVDWQAGDLGYNLLATGSIIVAIEELRRVIKVFNTWSSKNAYLAEHIVAALGFSYTDIKNNKSYIKEQLVSLIAAFNLSVVAPKYASYYQRQLFVSTNIFADSMSEWAQFYAYKCAGFFKVSKDSTYLELLEVQRSDVHEYIDQIWAMIDAITADDSLSEMYNDLRHAFKSDIVQLEEFNVSDNNTMTFNADRTNRMQIHNIKTMPVIASENLVRSSIIYGEWQVHQDTQGWLYQGVTDSRLRPVRLTAPNASIAPTMANQLKYFLMPSGGQLLDTGDYVPNQDGFLEITRGVPIARSISGSSQTGIVQIDIAETGTEFILDCNIYVLDGAHDDAQEYVFGTYMLNSITSTFAGETPIHTSALVSTFNWHPIVQFLRGYNAVSGAPDGVFTVSELEYTFVAQNADLTGLHMMCVQSEFYLGPEQFKA